MVYYENRQNDQGQEDEMTPDEFLHDSTLGLAVFERAHAILEAAAPFDVRVTKSQIAFRRRRGFAFIWRPTRYLGDRGADVVLAIALGRRDVSPRWKQVAHPTARHWIHHLEIRSIEDVDDEVAAWLREAAERAT